MASVELELAICEWRNVGAALEWTPDRQFEMTLAEIERAKLTASFLNALASGTILAAIVAPYIGWGLGTLQLSSDAWNIAGLSAFGFVVGLMLHLFARRVLGGLDE